MTAAAVPAASDLQAALLGRSIEAPVQIIASGAWVSLRLAGSHAPFVRVHPFHRSFLEVADLYQLDGDRWRNLL